jgi:hypothetical protein
MEADMARLQASARPIVVSFRRHCSQQQDSTMDSELSGGSTSTGPEVYVSLEELTKNNSHLMSRKSIKLKKKRDKFNETYLSVICRDSKPISAGGREKTVRPLNDEGDSYSGGTFSSNCSFPCSLRLENQPEDYRAPSWYIGNDRDISLPWPAIDTEKKRSMGMSLLKDNTENSSKNDDPNSMDFEKPIKYPKIEDIEIFQEQHLKIQRSFKKRQRNSRHRSKRHKDSSATSIEHLRNSHDTPNVKFEAIRNGAEAEAEVPRRTVSRSSTLPAFYTVSKNRQKHFTDADAKIRRLRHPLSLHTSYNNLDRSLIVGEGSNFILSTQLPERATRKKCINTDILGSNIILKTASHVNSGAGSLREQSRSLPDINETSRCSVHTSANDNIDLGFNNGSHGAKSLLLKQTKILLKEGQSDTVGIPHPQIHSVDEEIFKKKSQDILSNRQDEQGKIMEGHPSVLHEKEKLPV